MKWFQDLQGNVSSMRIMAMMSTTVGCLAVVAGVVAMFMGINESIAIAGVGAGMAGLGEIAKAAQAKVGG